MARIRTLKPEIWDDEDLAATSHEAQLLFVKLITQADDEGRFRAKARLLRPKLYPYDDGATSSPETTTRQIEIWLNELATRKLIQLYSDGKEILGQFKPASWLRHQKIDKRTPSRLPAPQEEQSVLFPVGFDEGSTSPREESSSARRALDAGSGREQELGRDLDLGAGKGAQSACPPARGPEPKELDLQPYVEALRRWHPGFCEEYSVSAAVYEARRTLQPIAEFEEVLQAWAQSREWAPDPQTGRRFHGKAANFIRKGGHLAPPPSFRAAVGRFPGAASAPEWIDDPPEAAAIDCPRWLRIAAALPAVAHFTPIFETELEIVVAAPSSRDVHDAEEGLRGALNRAAATVDPLLSIVITAARITRPAAQEAVA